MQETKEDKLICAIFLPLNVEKMTAIMQAINGNGSNIVCKSDRIKQQNALCFFEEGTEQPEEEAEEAGQEESQ